ncbi:MAG: AcvB/VirJ family lysyl-phosphatidylglycerol hydrolase, partial [Gammaproteobacteria bacterium]
INVSEFGEVTFFGPQQVTPRGFAFLFSGDDGLNVHDQTASDRLKENGVVVAAINSRIALKRMEPLEAGQGCIDLARSLQRVSQGAQSDWKFSQYHPPVLLGRGIGGALVYVALAQAWPHLFAGGISVDTTLTIKLDRTLCGLMTRAVNSGQRLTPPSPPLQTIWQAGSTGLISPDVSALALAVARPNDAGKVQVVGPKTLTALYYNAVDFFLKRATPETGRPGSLVSLPIVEISNDVAENTLVIVYSNEAGWQVIERGFVEVFKNEGYAVLGIDGSRYLWSQKTPASLAQDLAHIMEYYQYKWGVDRVVLVGNKSGATVLPFAYNRLASKFQNSVSLMTLVSPKRAAQFVVGRGGWLSDKPQPVLWPLQPEIRELDLDRVQCIYAHIEANDSLCTTTAMRKVELIEESRIDPRDLEEGNALAEFTISRIERGRQGDSK